MKYLTTFEINFRDPIKERCIRGYEKEKRAVVVYDEAEYFIKSTIRKYKKEKRLLKYSRMKKVNLLTTF